MGFLRTTRRWRAGRRCGVGLGLILAVGHLGCAVDPPSIEETTAPALDELVVLTRYSPTTYYIDRLGHPAGPEYDLVTTFAESIGLPVRFVVLGSIEEILQELRAGHGDLAAAGLTWTVSRVKRLRAGIPYQVVREMAVCRSGSGVRRPRDLVGRSIGVVAGSSYVETLERWQRDLPELEWEPSGESAEELLRQVAEGRLDCTVADSTIVAIDRRLFPQVRTPFALTAGESLVWYFSDRGARLEEPAQEWMEAFRSRGGLDSLVDRYYSHVQDFDRYDTTIFFRRIETRLSHYRELFERAAEEVDLPWTLLAAVSYQESHWDPAAVSVTGVRGLMMLTTETATELGIDDRTDPAASALAGARYLKQQIDRVPSYIEQPDRLWMGLAAYNVGYAHLHDARRLAVELGHNPNRWADLKIVLPYLSQPRYFPRLRHGYARGWEPVLYVRQVRNYFDLLQQVEPPEPPDSLPTAYSTPQGSMNSSDSTPSASATRVM